MSYRVSDESAVVDALIVAGDGALAREVADRCGEALEMPGKLAEPGRAVEMPKGIPELERLAAVPLVGLLLESALERPALDFAKPRRGADPNAARRQRVLAAALGLIVMVGGAWVYASAQLGALDRSLKEAQARAGELRSEYNAYVREAARLEHLKQWTGAGIDWISHTRWLTDQMPDPRQAQLDQLSGRLKADVVFTPRSGGVYDHDGWRLAQTASFSLAGKVKRRELADDFRDRLVNSQVFRVENKGPDVPDRFALELSTKLASPEESGRAPPSSPAPKTGGGQ